MIDANRLPIILRCTITHGHGRLRLRERQYTASTTKYNNSTPSNHVEDEDLGEELFPS